MHTPARHPDRTTGRGFTLTETLIATTVLSLSVIALISPLSLAAQHQRLDAIQTTASALASQRLERMATFTQPQRLAADGTTEQGTEITGFDGRPMNDATLADFTLTIAAQATPITRDDEAQTFCVVRVTLTHPETAPVTVARLFSE